MKARRVSTSPKLYVILGIILAVLVAASAMQFRSSGVSSRLSSIDIIYKTLCEIKPNFKYGVPKAASLLTARPHCYDMALDKAPHGVCSPHNACTN